tara:strand:- start:477 stop:1496 length:1020 start_codon:yes stop_codon:yes gene_type:complete
MYFGSRTNLLITGGTGSFGKAFLKKILQNFPEIKRIVVLSRDELKQWELQSNFPADKFPSLRFFLGDIRDKTRLKYALEDIDVVVHAAALKQVPAAEYNPIEFIKTNIIGAQNLIEACIETNVKKVIALSTDKAAAPINLYGATKLCSDKLFISANNIIGSRNLTFSVVRYGNVMGSRGSVIPFFIKEAKKGIIPITHENMTRFNITLDEGVEMVISAIKNSLGGEIFVPKIPSYRILDLTEAIAPSCEKKIIGIRPGEKIHEELITSSDSYTTYSLGDNYIIFPRDEIFKKRYEANKIKIEKVKQGFSYNSGENPDFLTSEDIRKLIIENIEPNFVPF